MSERSSLPMPSSQRWKPLRGGLLNLYLYDDQEFLYEGGRLLLRGNNGTGKSRVLALQLPFLLDGQVTPLRVEPDGDPARKIEWHLLMGQRYPARTGYTWIEFGRRTEEGEAQTLTLGIGMEALQGKGLKRRWYFVTELRVGESLTLTGPQGTALGPKELEEALGARGTLYERSEAYRAEVDRRLFGLGKERYEALLELLIGLRRPQLSRKLDEKGISEALSLALPPLSSATLNDVAEAFRRLESERAELERYRVTAKTAKEFERLHTRYLALEAKRRAAELRAAHSKYEAIAKEKNEKREALDAATVEEERLTNAQGDLERSAKALEAKEQALGESDEMRAAERLGALEEDVRAARASTDEAT
ncbi:MAG: TIGR02680 family protein, partial [Polyangiaceae bacterium]|nr:TIGR02680 family protein [Polyangiaceae bacterium]